MVQAGYSGVESDAQGQFVGVLGFVSLALTQAAFLSMFLIFPMGEPDAMSRAVFRLVAALSLVASFAVIDVTSEWQSKTRARSLLAAAIVGVGVWVPLVLLWGALPFEMRMAGTCLESAGLAAMATMQFNYVCCDESRCTVSYFAFSLFVATGLCGVAFFVPDDVCKAMLVINQAAPAVIYIVERFIGIDDDRRVRVGRSESKKRSRIQPASVVTLVIVNFQAGYVASLISDQFIVLFPVLLVVLLGTGLDSLAKRFITEQRMRRIVISLSTVAISTMFLFDGEWGAVSICLLAVVSAHGLVFGCAALAKHVRLTKLSAVFAYSRARALDFLGLAVGVAVGALVGQLGSESQFAAVQASVLVMCVYVFITMLTSHARFPEVSMVEGAKWNDEDAEASASAAWKRRCYIVSENYGLSERQYEVLCLIAQGRNAERVARDLVISVSTAQTHIRNIYRKMDVHSRQELFDLIEETKLYEED